VKKIIILLMAVLIILTSCGKSAGLSNGGKRADNKTPATNTSTKTLPQKIDNDKYKQSLTDYAKDHKTAIGFISVAVIVITIIAVGSYWIINKNNNEPPQTTELEKQPQPSKAPEANGQPRTPKPPKKLMPLPVVDPLSFTVPSYLISFFTSPPANGDYDKTDLSLENDFALVYFYIYDKTILAGWRPPIKKELADRGFDVSSLI
jgi:flagellar basal body-associated protein FliL